MPDPEKSTSWPEMTAILLARLSVLWLLVVISLLRPGDDTVFYAFIGIAFIITIPCSLWLRSRLVTMQFVPLQFIIDLVLVTGTVYLTGGLRSPFTLLYPLVILSAGIVSMYLSTRGNTFTPPQRTVSETVSTLLESIPVPMLLLTPEGLIVYANDLACDTLHTTEQALCAQTFSAICHTDGKQIPESLGRSAYLMRETMSPLPVSYTTRDISIPQAALPGAKNPKNNHILITLLLFTDITDAMKTTRQLEQIDRITSATRIAGEMAHEIRAPLSTLSASVQLLRHYEDRATAADWLPNSPRRNDRRELFEHIEDASARMDSVIRNFVDFAEFSPQDLLSIIKLDSIEENQGYIDHLNTTGRDLKDGQNTHSG